MKNFLLILLLIIFIPICQSISAENRGFWVKSVGNRENIINGRDLSGNISIANLKNIKNLYAIGPIANLQGEVTIYNSRPALSRVVNNKLFVSQKFDGQAAFLIYSSVLKWTMIKVDHDIVGLDAIEEFVKVNALANGLSLEQPFPFRFEGIANEMKYHIIFKSNTAPHNQQEHHNAKHNFNLTNQSVNIIGFWVDKNRMGQFTHPEKRTHLHMQTKDNKASGHIDFINISKNSILYLPKQTK
jgi:acetolactate decarboxylase